MIACASALAFCACALPASAEEQQPSVWPADINAAEDYATPAAESTESEPEGQPAQTVDLTSPDIDWSQLDTTASAAAADAKTLSNPKARQILGDGSSWSSQDNPNGKALSVKQPVSPFWDTRVGADVTVARQSSALTASEILSEKLANGGSLPQSSGAAWAAATAPGVGSIWDKTSIEARLDPAQEQSRLGTSLSKSMPLSERYSITLQNGYNVIQQGIVPSAGLAGRPSRNYETDQSARLNINDSGTSLIAGQSLSSTDDKWLRKIGAEQKLFGGVSVTGSVGETSQGTANKSISAGFKRSW